MFKIDLHVHTKKILNGEKETRNIEPKKFKEIMKEANVKFIAITNHWYFEDKNYKEFKDDNYVLLPAVEVQINDENNNKKHLNIIFNPKKSKKLEDKIKKIKEKNKNNNLENLSISKKELIEDFDSEDTIFYLETKNHKEWKQKEIDSFIKIEKNGLIKGLIILDAKVQTHRILLANNYLSLIGSDVSNWNEYCNKLAPKLLEFNLDIQNYSTFVNVLKEKKSF